MKFYIPTSNLNLDNILQSECILPYSHYSHRCSGFKTFEQIDELRSYEAIVLFKYPVQFLINDTGRYNFPMLIELEDDIQTSDFADKEIQNGVCLCNHRLNLTPLNCRIYFFAENAYKLTLINTQSSKAIKFFKEYKIYPNASMLKLVNMPQLKEMSCDISKFEDNLIDKQKGLFYAFLLGNKMSVNRNLAIQLRLMQELYNILTNLISSPSNIASFGTKLANLLNCFKEVDNVETNNLRLFNDNFDKAIGKNKDDMIDGLKRLKCWDVVRDKLCKDWNCSFLPDISNLNTDKDYSLLRDEIERRTIHAISEYSNSIPEEDLTSIQISGDYVEFIKARLVNIVIRYIMANSITPEKLLANRMGFYMNVMTEIVSILKDEMGEQAWQDSKEKAYVNNIYAFINDPAFSFELNGVENVELKSIAAFILRGQSFKDCVAYLRINEVEDYRFVLSLWGCLCGYMEMNKDALCCVLSMSNYELVYQKVFGTELAEITQNIVTSFTQDHSSESIDYNLFNQILGVFKYKDSASLIRGLNECHASEESIEKDLNEILSKRKRASRQCENARHALKIYLNRDSKITAIDIVEKTSLSGAKKKVVLSLLGFDESKSNKKGRKLSEQASLFAETDLGNDIKPIKDDIQPNVVISSIGQSISHLSDEVFPNIPIANRINSNVHERLEKNWKFTGLKYKDDRREHIRFFVNLCKKEGRGDSKKPTSLFNVFTIQLAEQIEKELLEYYGLR